MRKLVRTTLVLASALALALTGCRPPLNLVRPDGSGFIGGAGIAMEPQGNGGMNVSIKWPPPMQRATQAIPAVANTLHLKVTTREGVTKTSRIFNRPATTESLISTASLTVGVGSSLMVEVNAYRQQFATDSIGVLPSAEQIIAQGTQENVTITLNATTSVQLKLDPDVTVAGKGGADSLGLRKIPWSLIDNDPRGPAIWTELNSPEHLVYDPAGKYLYFTEKPDPGRLAEGYRIMRLSLNPWTEAATGTYGVMTLVGGGAPLNVARSDSTAFAPFVPITNVRGVATDNDNRLYYSEQGLQNRIRRVEANDRITDFATDLGSPEGLLVHGDRLYVADSGRNQVYAYDLADGALAWTAGGGSDNLDGASTSFIPRASASIPIPMALAASGTSLYVASGAGRVLEINLPTVDSAVASSVRTLTAIAGQPPTTGNERLDSLTFGALGGIAASGGYLYLSDTFNRGVWRTPDGNAETGATRLAGFGAAGLLSGQYKAPGGLVKVGNYLYVCDTGNNRVQRIDVTNGSTIVLAGRLDGAADMINGPSGEDDGVDSATLWAPRAIATRSVGTDMVVADSGSARLRGVSATGFLTALQGVWSLSRLSRGVGLTGHELYLGEIAGLSLAPAPAGQSPSLYVITTDKDDNSGGQAVYRLNGLDDPAFVPGYYEPQRAHSVVTTELLFENMLSRLGSTAPRVVQDPTGIGVDPNDGSVVFSVAGVFHTLLEWDGVNYELTYGGSSLPGQGYRTFAGTGAAGYNGEGPASLVQLNQPRRVRYDRDGNCYFLSLNGNGATILRRVGTNGKISTIAGGGSLAVPPVAGPQAPVSAVQANIGSVADFDLDSQGNVYLASGTRILRMDQRAASMTEVYSAANRSFTSIAFDENDAAILFTYSEEPKIKKVYLSRLF